MSLTPRERQEIAQANASGRKPVVFVHGLWMLASSWAPWRAFFEENGYATIVPGWPDDPETVAEARANPEVFAGKSVKQVTDHMAEAIGALGQPLGRPRPLLRRPDHPTVGRARPGPQAA